MRKSLKKIAALATASVLALAAAVTAVPATADAAVSKAAKKAAKAEYDPAGTYHAYFGLQQTGTWIFRDPWHSDTLGTEGSEFKEYPDVSFNDILQSSSDGPAKMDGTVIDAEITGNGVYTVGVEGLNGCLTADATAAISMIFVNTDIPVAAKETLTISDVKLVMDNKTVSLPEEVFFNEEDELATGLLRFDPYNSYQRDQGAYPECPSSVLNPSDSIKITFTVSGMTNDNPDAVEATPTPAPEADDSASADSADAADDAEDSGSSTPVVIAIIAVVVIAGVVIVVTKKKK